MRVLEELLNVTTRILYDPLLLHRLHDINNVSRWKHSIESKLEEGVLAGVFDEQDLADITAIQFDMLAFAERKSEPENNIKNMALEYFRSHSAKLMRLTAKIAPIHIEKTHKLPELTKLMKEIDKLTINDSKLTELKRNFSAEISHCESWK
jgi:hypothetical protein